MAISPASTVADIATSQPATIRVFQQHGIDFCCGGRVPLSEACAAQGLETGAVIADLEAAVAGRPQTTDWSSAPPDALIGYIQARFHEPLRAELPRLQAMVDKVVSRHGDRYGATLRPLQTVFTRLRADLLDHMAAEDDSLFPAIAAGESFPANGPLAAFEAEHADAGAALAEMRRLTNGYVPPADACPTFRGLYFGLSELEREMHEHVHLENHVLFPRAARSRVTRPTRCS